MEDYFHKGHEQFQVEYRMKHKNGSWIWVAARGKIVAYDKEGNPVRITGTVSDISIRRERESQLHALSQKRIQWIETICTDMGRKAGLTSYQISKLIMLVRVHDLGMISAPEHIVRSSPNQKLSKEDQDILRHHTYKGQSIALTCKDLEDVADLIFLHHEQWDGRGYPLGLSGKDIPIECRIMDIVKSFDALTNLHLKGSALSESEALEEIKNASGSRFDPRLVQLFLQTVSFQK